ncbi:MAG: hypothetical protein ACPGJE_02625, partial [Wenzhouxiangellaceae bacterium]
ESWVELSAGMPTIAVRDLEIQRRENDLVIATFGRGIRILDDYRALRTPAADVVANEATLFPIRDPWLYVEDDVWGFGPKGFQGETYYVADNPPFGAVFTYYLRDGYKSLRDERREAERERLKSGVDNPYPSWDELRRERREDGPAVVFEISDSEGKVIRRISGPHAKGLHRVAWDLRHPAPDPVNLNPPGFRAPWDSDPQGVLVAPGTYRVQLFKRVRGELEALNEPLAFEVKRLDRGQFRPDSFDAHEQAMLAASDLTRAVLGAARALGELDSRAAHLNVALRDTPESTEPQRQRLMAIETRLDDIGMLLNGDSIRAGASEPRPMALSRRVSLFSMAHWNALAAITGNQQRSLDIARDQFDEVQSEMAQAAEDLAALERELRGIAPWTPGRIPELRE